MLLDAVGLIANVENLKNKCLVPNVDIEQTSYDHVLEALRLSLKGYNIK